MSTMQTLALVSGLVSSVVAHGTVSGIVVGGKYYQGYSPSFAYADPAPVVIGWSIPEDSDNGFIAPSAFSDPDIICHKGATPGQTSAKVAAGGTVELQWTAWPESHHGPVLDYLAKCSGKCEDADKTSLDFFKISEGGLIDGSSPPGTWASDDLIANNNTWVVTIPESIAPGNYVLRHEIIALHSAGDQDGAQAYPQCVNLVITGSGSETYAGEPATEFYKADDPGILVSIYQTLTSYKIPGPALISGGSSGGEPSAPESSAPAAPSSSAPASSAPASEPAPSEPATSYSGPAASSSAGPISSSAAPVPSSSAPAPSSSKCTQTITVTASSSAVHSSVVAPVSSSAYASVPYYPSGSASSIVPAGTGSVSGGFSITYFHSSSAGPISSSAGTISYPVPTSSAPATPPSYPTDPAPPAGGESDYASLMAKIIKMIKQFFRQAEHGRDFKRA